jgi:ligand-binding sensor domain-containing protein
LALNRLKQIGYTVLSLCLVGVISCEEDTSRPDPPPPPPALALELYRIGADPTHRLVDNEVYDIVVDGQGNVWFATDNGVDVADGVNPVVHYDDFNGIPNRKIRTIGYFNNKIFVGTWGGGVAIFRDPDWEALPILDEDNNQPGVAAGKVADLAQDALNTTMIWCGTVGGLTRYEDNDARPMRQRFTPFTNLLEDNPNEDDPETLTKWRNISSVLSRVDPVRGREVWVSRVVDGIVVLRPSLGQRRFTFRTTTSAIPSNNVNKVVWDPTAGVFRSAHPASGIASVDVGKALWTNTTRVDGLESDLALSLGVRSNGDIWVGTQTGVSKITAAGEITNYTAGSGLPDARVRTVYVDPMDRVWLGFVGAGAGLVEETIP